VLPDTDGDGLDDGSEIAFYTDPLNPDSDYDGILDGEDPDVLYHPDLIISSGPSSSDVSPTEGAVVTLSADISNLGSHDSEGVVVAFFDGDPDSGGRYICADFVSSIPTATAELAQCVWDTSGSAGSHEIYVIVDPLDRIAEENEGNNTAYAALTVLTKADLRIVLLSLSEAEVVEGQSITVTATVQNDGQTDVADSALVLYKGTSITGTIVQSTTVAVGAAESVTVAFSWITVGVGPQPLTVQADANDQVLESDEGNNDAQTTAHIGWGSPVYVDAGGTPDPTYAPSLGYGLVSTNTTAIETCGDTPDLTYRQGVYGQPLQYRFDHLLPSHYYHLDTTMSVCAGQRLQYLWVDGVQVAGPLTVTAAAPTRHSLLVDPDTYEDHTILVNVTASGLAAPAVAELRLIDIYYCYRDCGSSDNDPLYAEAIRCGYYDPLSQASDLWGDLPTQTVRFDPNDSNVVYRFSGLDPADVYQVRLTLYENDGAGRQETIRIDGVTVGPTVTLGSEPQYLVVPVPSDAYAGDGMIDVAIVEITEWNAPVVSEIALEQVTIAVPPQAKFSANPLTGTAPLTVTYTDQSSGGVVYEYEWWFGDGYTSTLQNPIHTYQDPGTYTVTLAVNGPGGSDSHTEVSYITVYQPAQADFVGTPLVGQAPLTVTFTDTSTGTVTTWLWEFGDGGTSTSQHPTHTYTLTGTFSVSLTIDGPSGTDTKVETGYIRVSDEPLIASFTAFPTDGPAPLDVEFTDGSVGSITAWLWDFGDGYTSTLPSPGHIYTAPGVYTVTLVISGATGTDRLTRPSYIEVYDPVYADFAAEPTSGDAPLVVTFTNASRGDYTSCLWEFGDQTTSPLHSPTHTYDAAGVYTVTLTISGLGGIDTRTKESYITVSEQYDVYLPLVMRNTSAQ
jgi:PKD repeat protein